MTNLYRDILRRAWHLLWQHPWLWVFGVFASVTVGAGEYTSLVTSMNRLMTEINLVINLKSAIYTRQLEVVTAGFKDLLSQPTTLMVIMAAAVAAVILFFVWLVTVSQIALIESAGRLGRGEPVSFMASARSGWHHFWSVFWLNILTKLIIYLLLVVATLPFLITFLVRMEEAWSFSWLFFISFFIFIPLSLLVVFILRYAVAYVVLERHTWWEALERGTNLFFKNWLVSIETSAVLLSIVLVLGLVLWFILPENLILRVAVLTIEPTFPNFLRVLPSLVVVAFTVVGYGVFQYLVWILLFDRLTQGTALAKLIRLTDEVPNHLEKWFAGPRMVKNKIGK